MINKPAAFYKDCTLCPRSCHADRANNSTTDKASIQKGYCGQNNKIRLAWAGLHKGEEPPISGEKGSGTVFFSGCNLKCSFCQNSQISHSNMGMEIEPDSLADVFIALDRAGAENLNLVTGTPHIPGILSALSIARDRGMDLPVIWNTSGYEAGGSLELLDDAVDIYLTDIKTLDPALAGRLFEAPNYPAVIQSALPKMLEGRETLFRKSSLVKGVIARHLVLPGELKSTHDTLKWFREEIYGKAILSLMFQFSPIKTYQLWSRRISREEYENVLLWVDELGIEEGFIQELEKNTFWFPDFTRQNPFPIDQSHPIWHWRKGFIEPAEQAVSSVSQDR
jgi:putative pyruvate formate lyase activating enzyme